MLQQNRMNVMAEPDFDAPRPERPWREGRRQPESREHPPAWGDRSQWAGEGDDTSHRFDPDYQEWRAEQMRQLDRDYALWRQERYRKFADEFDTWRRQRFASQRRGPEPSQASSSGSGSAAADRLDTDRNRLERQERDRGEKSGGLLSGLLGTNPHRK